VRESALGTTNSFILVLTTTISNSHLVLKRNGLFCEFFRAFLIAFSSLNDTLWEMDFFQNIFEILF